MKIIVPERFETFSARLLGDLAILRTERLKQRFRSCHVPLGRIRFYNNLGRSREIRLYYAWGSNYDHGPNAIQLVGSQLLPNQPSVVTAAWEAVNCWDILIVANKVGSSADLFAVTAWITGHIQYFSAEPDTARIIECRSVIKLATRVLRISNPSQYEHHLLRGGVL
jgi:hypothetical protein